MIISYFNLYIKPFYMFKANSKSLQVPYIGYMYFRLRITDKNQLQTNSTQRESVSKTLIMIC